MDDNFEWDPEKRVSNFHKHNIDFLDAARVFADPWRITLHVTKPAYRERRYQVIGMMDDGRIISVVYTRRGSKIRIISARKARRDERQVYNQRKTAS